MAVVPHGAFTMGAPEGEREASDHERPAHPIRFARGFGMSIREVSVGGVPLPNAWLGSLKDVNLVGEHLENDPGLQAFWAGIEELEIQPDGLRVRLSH